MVHADVQLLVVRIPAHLDHFETIEQRRRDGGEIVGCGEEDDARQIERNIHIVVNKFVVLFRIEHLEQCSCRVSPCAIHPHLVNLVEEKERVPHACTADRLQNPPRHGGDVRAPVATNLRLVAHASKRDPMERSAEDGGDGGGEGGFADAGRPGEAEDGRPRLWAQPPHCDVLYDAFLHLLEAIVLLLERGSRLRHRPDLRLLALLGPRQVHDPLHPRAPTGVPRLLFPHAPQLFELALREAAHLSGERRARQPLFERSELVLLRRRSVPELVADRLQLLPQHVLALRLGHAPFHLAGNVERHNRALHLRFEQRQRLLQARLGAHVVQQLEPFVEALLERCHEEVREPVSRRALEQRLELEPGRAPALQLLHHLLCARAEAGCELLQLAVARRGCHVRLAQVELLHLGQEKRLLRHALATREPAPPFQQKRVRERRHLRARQLQHARSCPDVMQRGLRSVALRPRLPSVCGDEWYHPHQALGPRQQRKERRLDERNHRRAREDEAHHGAREQHPPVQRENGQLRRKLHVWGGRCGRIHRARG
mmetsp:Transcript_29064/g.94898  ORF Transcript_29064/g.94898 Transcript_29064/m.94898 type:complete len:542 (-) Transcript_29064:1148-2773(-)